MKKTIAILFLAITFCAISCNEKPKKEQPLKTYKFVQVLDQGEQVNDFEAKNDTDALYQYFKMIEKIIIANLDKEDSGIKAMYVVSPDGDTLNTKKELLDEVAKNLPAMTAIPAKKAPAAPLKPNKPTR